MNPALRGRGDGKETTRVLCGFHAVESALSRYPAGVVRVCFDRRRHDPRSQRLQRLLEKDAVTVERVDREELDRLSEGVRHQGVVALVRPVDTASESALQVLLERIDGPALLLVLDQVQDPHNLGACLRSADGAGVHAVILPRDGACPVNETVSRVAAGAVDNVPIFYVANLVRTLDALRERGVWITGTTEEAETVFFRQDFTTDCAIVMGSEGKGLRRLTREHCDHLVRIPMSGEVSSLNVSVATGLLLYEAVRQRSGEE